MTQKTNKRKQVKSWLSLLLALSVGLSGCSILKQKEAQLAQSDFPFQNSTGQEPAKDQNEEFEADMQDLFVTICESDYDVIHTNFIDPEQYGLDPSKAVVSLGSFSLEQDEEDEAFDQEVLDLLRSYDPQALSDRNSDILKQLLWLYENSSSLDKENYLYLPCLWSNLDGVPNSVMTYFTSYSLYHEEDIPYLLEQFSDLDRFVGELEDFSIEQGKKGMLRIDLTHQKKFIETLLAQREENEILDHFQEEIDGLELSEEQKEEQLEKISHHIDTFYYPAFEKMLRGLEKLEPLNKPITGLANLEHGKDYYAALLRSYTGTSKSVEEIESFVQKELRKAMTALLPYGALNGTNFYGVLKEKSGLESPEQMLRFFKDHYRGQFPEIGDVKIDINPMNELDAMNEGSLAYVLSEPVDYKGAYKVFYHPDRNEQTTLSFYDTLAHETIPGHVYQAVFSDNQDVLNIQYLMKSLAYMESWANYAAGQAIEWLDIDPETKELYQLVNKYEAALVLQIDLEINYHGLSQKEIKDKYGVKDEFYTLIAQNPGLYFAYHYGFLQMENWKNKAKQELGAAFDLVSFNELFLQAGTINFDLLEEKVDQYIAKKKNLQDMV